MIGRRCMRAINRDDVHPGEHLIEALPIGCVQFFFGSDRHAAAVVIMNFQTKGVRTPRHGLPYPSHADNTEPLAPDTVAEHPGWAPTTPFLTPGKHLRAF